MLVKNNVISCDFDGTLDDHFGGEEVSYKKATRDMLKRLIRKGYDVHIVTRRFGPENSHKGITDEHLKVWKVAEEIGIPKEKVLFTNREWKFETIKKIGAFMHIDDDDVEMYWLSRHLPEVTRIYVDNKNWDEQIISRIEDNNHLAIWLSSEKNILTFMVVAAMILLFCLII